MMVDMILWMLLGAGVLFLVVLVWVLIYYWLEPHVEDPDGKARVTGTCGDTMEISLKFKGDRVVESAYWTDGCAMSLNCVCAGAELARGRTPDEIIEIDMERIREAVGGLPVDKVHCAQLSVDTLHAALEDFMIKTRKGRAAGTG